MPFYYTRRGVKFKQPRIAEQAKRIREKRKAKQNEPSNSQPTDPAAVEDDTDVQPAIAISENPVREPEESGNGIHEQQPDVRRPEPDRELDPVHREPDQPEKHRRPGKQHGVKPAPRAKKGRK